MATSLLRRLAPASPPTESASGSLSIQQVYQAHFHYVWRCLRGLGVREQALDDAAHDVFLVVQRKLADFDGSEARLTTWLYEIALRVARRYRTESAKDAQRSVSLAPPEPEEETDQALPAAAAACQLEKAERLTLARRALDALDASKREVFVLGCVEQRSAPEIAQLTGVPLNTVYSRLRAARRAFAAEVARLQAARGRRAS